MSRMFKSRIFWTLIGLTVVGLLDTDDTYLGNIERDGDRCSRCHTRPHEQALLQTVVLSLMEASPATPTSRGVHGNSQRTDISGSWLPLFLRLLLSPTAL